MDIDALNEILNRSNDISACNPSIDSIANESTISLEKPPVPQEQPSISSLIGTELVSFESILLKSLRTSSNIAPQAKKPKRKVCYGAEVITSEGVLKRLAEKDKSLRKSSNKIKRSQNDLLNKAIDESTNENNKPINNKRKIKKRSMIEIESTSEEDGDLSANSGNELYSDEFEDYEQEEADLHTLGRNIGDIAIDDWILVKFIGKRSVKHYVAKIINVYNNEINVKFVRKSMFFMKKSIFVFPDIDDCSIVSLSDIIALLPNPKVGRRGEISFEVSFAMYNVQ